MTFSISLKRKIALTLLVVWIFNLVIPNIAYALTSGPIQPEAKGFQPAGVSDMVDLFTGDFKYNIPLMDVGGYPLNLNYQSGTGIDDEASWVGLGWNINVGSINRQLRGIPDDFSGDGIQTEHYTKPKVTVGGRLTAKVETKGKVKGGGSLSFGVFSDNYTGVGAELGANAGLSFSLANDGFLTAGLGVGVNSNTVSGVDFSPYISLSIADKTKRDITTSAGLTASFGYNTRSGSKDLTLGTSFGVSASDAVYQKNDQGQNTLVDGGSGSGNYSIAGSSVSYNTEPVSPKIQIPYKSTFSSFSFDLGGLAWIVFAGGGGTGYKSVREVARRTQVTKGYGFLYSNRGSKDKFAAMDFIREKDNPIIPELPNLAIPVHTPDLFSYTSQGSGGQFKVFQAGTGAFFDNMVSDESYVSTGGFDAGVGAYAHGGVSKYDQSSKNTTKKWAEDNAYVALGDFQTESKTTDNEHAYFRQVGEKTVEDTVLTQRLLGTKAIAVSLNGTSAASSFRYSNNYSNVLSPVNGIIRKNSRQIKRTSISYLTALEASMVGLQKAIITYPFNELPGFDLAERKAPEEISEQRVDKIVIGRKEHHISEITVTDDVGKRLVYGVPVYNVKQEEYTFAIGEEGSSDGYSIHPSAKNQIASLPVIANSVNHYKGIDHYYHKETQPAYASSFLLSGILSADYVDKSGDGISPDDAGTAIDFKYSKSPFVYKWRTPYANATVNRGLSADPDDDKANIVYGEKELYYLHSIRSKTMTAFFITEEREDALGVLGWQGGVDNQHKQRCLKEIQLYSNEDLTKPIKTVRFEYSYELCPGVPNSGAPYAGKLTLKKVYFVYGTSEKGQYYPYVFNYKQKPQTSSESTRYSYISTDRWGVYKGPNANLTSYLSNEEFPYTMQDSVIMAENAALWHLERIELPTGGIINVTYESDDYAFVQDKQAMVMSGVNKLITESGAETASLREAKGVRIPISESTVPSGTSPLSWFKKNYLNSSDYLYTKFCIKVATDNANERKRRDWSKWDWDFISCYAKVKSVIITEGFANVIFEDINEGGRSVNPIINSAWQKLKNEYPRYAYRGFDNRIKDSDAGKALRAAINAIVDAAFNLSELKENFYQKAYGNNYASEADLKRSFVRIAKVDGKKLGGGLRVKIVRISDNWQEMTGDETDISGSYGQSYEYTTTYNGRQISSGVAAYEPAIGNDENPLKQPVPYVQNIKGALNNFFALEKPFGESFFPAPVVGYSKVTIRDLKKDGIPDPSKRTGYIVNEFYTARDFPVYVEELAIQNYQGQPKKSYSMFKSSAVDLKALSQGYSIELNDMHGKPKATRVYNQSHSEISSTVYHYNASPTGLGQWKLKNTVNIIDENGKLSTGKVIGREIEFFTDLRQQESTNNGTSIHIGGDLMPAFFVPLFLPHFPKYDNSEYKLFRSASAVKVIQYYGVVDKVVKTENGSSITTENVAYDGITGEALVTKTQNEFNRDIYSVNLPAYWVYKGMGPAYRNLGIVLDNLSTKDGIVNLNYADYLHGGDEIADLGTGELYWIIDHQGDKILVNRNGLIQKDLTITSSKVIRSGLRNLLQASTSNWVCLENPVKNGYFQLAQDNDLTAMKITNATVSVFDENWAVEEEPGGNLPGNQRYLLENTSQSFLFKRGQRQYCQGAYLQFENANNRGPLTTSRFWGNNIRYSFFFLPWGFGPFNRSSIWPSTQGVVSNNNVEALSIDTCITVNRSGDFYVGAGSSGQIAYKFDNDPANGNSYVDFANKWIVKKHTLSQGKHRLTITVYVTDNTPSDDYAGLEVYDNTIEQLQNADSELINILFSTGGLQNKSNLKTNRVKYKSGVPYATVPHYTELDGSPLDPCYVYAEAPGKKNINPYIHGYLGNWRLAEMKVFQEKRQYDNLFSSTKKGVGVKNAGYISNFYSYWSNPAQLSWTRNDRATKWITTNTVTLYDSYGQELENFDALGRYSAAKFDFNGELPAVVASNAMHREIYCNSFEDPGNNKREFKQVGTEAPLVSFIVKNKAHTGKSSLLVPASGLSFISSSHNRKQRSLNYLTFDPTKGFMTKDLKGLYPYGFEPNPGKRYIFNAWIKDEAPLTRSANISLQVNNTNIDLKCKAIVEGWKLLEGIIDLTSISAGDFEIRLSPLSSAIYLDDLRIHPFDAHIKSYVYNNQSFRLMAELDENCFSTFYEYDDEGSLIRVKKETEKGIVTLKESRSSYRKSNL